MKTYRMSTRRNPGYLFARRNPNGPTADPKAVDPQVTDPGATDSLAMAGKPTAMHTVADILPLVRYAGSFLLRPSASPFIRQTYDHRLFYVLSAGMTVEIAGERIRLHRSDLVIILSGTPYSLFPPAPGCNLLIVNFDFFGGENQPPDLREAVTLPVVSLNNFRPEKRVEQVDFRERVFPKGYLILPGSSDLLPELHTIVREAERGEIYCGSQVRSYFNVVLNRIIRRRLIPRPTGGGNSHEDILAYLSEHFAEPLTNHAIGQLFHYHPNYVGQLIRDATGMPLHRYLIRLRIRRAGELLLSGNYTVSEVACMTGFNDPAYFTQYFRRVVGCTPTVFHG